MLSQAALGLAKRMSKRPSVAKSPRGKAQGLARPHDVIATCCWQRSERQQRHFCIVGEQEKTPELALEGHLDQAVALARLGRVVSFGAVAPT